MSVPPVDQDGTDVVRPGRSRDLERWAGPATGIAGTVLTAVGLLLSDIAGLDGVNPLASPGTIAREIAGAHDRLHLGTTVLMVGLFGLLLFLVHLPQRLDPQGRARWMTSAAVAGGLIAVTLMALVVAYVRTATQITFGGGERVIPKAIVVFDWDYWRAFAPFISAHLIGVGMAGLRTATLPRTVAGAAVALALVPLIAPPGLMTVVFLLWILALAVVLLLRPARAAAPAPVAPAAA